MTQTQASFQDVSFWGTARVTAVGAQPGGKDSGLKCAFAAFGRSPFVSVSLYDVSRDSAAQ